MRTLARAGAQGIFPRAPAALYSGVRREEKMKRTLVQKLGLLGLVSFFSYAAAVIFAPLA